MISIHTTSMLEHITALICSDINIHLGTPIRGPPILSTMDNKTVQEVVLHIRTRPNRVVWIMRLKQYKTLTADSLESTMPML